MGENSRRDRLRQVTLGAPAVVQSARVEWGGEVFEVRRPTLKVQRAIDSISTDKKGKRDNLKALMQALVRCVYVPGTEDLVFEPADINAMEDRGVEDFVGAFMKALGSLSSDTTPEEIEKNFEGAPSDATL